MIINREEYWLFVKFSFVNLVDGLILACSLGCIDMNLTYRYLFPEDAHCPPDYYSRQVNFVSGIAKVLDGLIAIITFGVIDADIHIDYVLSDWVTDRMDQAKQDWINSFRKGFNND